MRLPGHTYGSMGYAFRKEGRTYVATGDLIMPGGVLGYSGSLDFSAAGRAGEPEEACRAAARRGAGRPRRRRARQLHRRRASRPARPRAGRRCRP